MKNTKVTKFKFDYPFVLCGEDGEELSSFQTLEDAITGAKEYAKNHNCDYPLYIAELKALKKISVDYKVETV